MLFYFWPSQPNVCELVRQLKPEDLQKSKDQGGHGGTIKVLPPVSGKHLFLKPKTADGTEARNYKVISTDSTLAKWMPTVHGEVKVDGQSYLVMENIRKSVDGTELKQLVDIKLSKQLDGLKNPIASNEEMLLTRGKTKSLLTRAWMTLASTVAPGFQITNGGVRLFDYIFSKRILKKSLANISTSSLNKLLADLRQMKRDVEQSGIAFIGASIVLVHQKEGSVKAVLIDPAHIQCSRLMSPQIRKVLSQEDQRKVFYEGTGKKDDYQLFKKSNSLAIESLIQLITKILDERPIKR